MKNLFRKKLVAGVLAFAVIAGALPLGAAAQTPLPPGTKCARWGLYWTMDDVEYGIVNGNPVGTKDPRHPLIFISNPVAAGDELSTATEPPPLPYPFLDEEAGWKCEEPATPSIGSTRTDTEKAVPAGMELCAQAAKLAAKFGNIAALNTNFLEKIQTSMLSKTFNFLNKTASNTLNVDVDFRNIGKSAFDAAGNFLSEQFNSLIGNSMKDSVNKKIDEITKGAKDLISKALSKNITEKILGSAGIPGLGASSVPTNDEKTQQLLKEQIELQKEQDAKQRIAEINADTRAKCKELLITTNETIKRALLYQLSTQIVDWIQTGETPQFIKQPGKFLEDTGRLALDRFISRVAPRLCEPFRLSVQLQIPSVRREDNPFYEQITCTLDRVVANVENFYQDFRQGGWIGYQEMLKPQNNYYGNSLAVMNEAIKQQAAAQAQAQQEQNRGYLAVKKCTKWAKFISYTGPTDNYVFDIRDGGNDNYFVRDSNADAEVTNGAGPLDLDGKVANILVQEPQTGRIEKGVRFWKNPYSPVVGNSYFWECEADEITQPANIAANLSEKASQMDLDNLAASQDVSMFLQTIEDSIINKLTKKGVEGFKGLLKGLPVSL